MADAGEKSGGIWDKISGMFNFLKAPTKEAAVNGVKKETQGNLFNLSSNFWDGMFDGLQEKIEDMLSKIPFIGGYFKKNVVTSNPDSSPSITSHPETYEAQRTEIVRLAESQLGVAEGNVNNSGTPQERYSEGNRQAWCANFVSWVYNQAGEPFDNRGSWRIPAVCDLVKHFQQCSDASTRFIPKESLTTQNLSQIIKKGDVFLCLKDSNDKDQSTGHTGIVTQVYEDGTFDTISGNTHNKVAKQKYRLNDPESKLVGFGSVFPA